MRVAIISDAHASMEALEAVLAYMDGGPPDEIWFLGDAVGYGPEPEECLALLRDRCSLLLLGNHDAGAVGLTPVDRFNVHARQALEFTAGRLGPESREYLAGLPLVVIREGATLVHASPFNPSLWHYVVSRQSARLAFESFTGPVCFIGHSHHPLVLSCDPAGEISARTFGELTLREGMRYVVNVGSVGQPRDGDPRSAFAMWDTGRGTVELVRVPYDIPGVQAKMAARELPRFLIERLERGV